MRHQNSICILALFFLALGAAVLAAEQGTQTETSTEEQVAEPSPDDKMVDPPSDTDKGSWSNVKALWG